MRTGTVVREVNKAFSWHHGRVAGQPWGVGQALNNNPVCGWAPHEYSYIGLFSWTVTLRPTWHVEQNMHIHAKPKVLEEQRILCCTWPLPGIQNIKHLKVYPPVTMQWWPGGMTLRGWQKVWLGILLQYGRRATWNIVHRTIRKPRLPWALPSLKPVCLFHWPRLQ